MTEERPPDREHVDQWSFTAPFEGVVPHLYLDTTGLPTCGVGFAVPTEQQLLRCGPWLPNALTALADYRRVRVAERGHVAAWYERHCTARLSEPTMRAVFVSRVTECRRAIRDWELERLPDAAQVALVDMAYNLGAAGLGRYDKLQAAVRACDWATAAAECHRRGVQPARNTATAALFMSLAPRV